TATPRQRTLRTLVDWSYDLLSAEEKTLFYRLSVFAGGAGGFTLEAAEAVCAGDGIAVEDVLDILAHLVNKSLVTPEPEPGGTPRYRLHETLRQYAAERLTEGGEA